MKKWTRLSVGLAAGFMLWSGVALGQEKSAGCAQTGAPANVEGRVVEIDAGKGKVTISEDNGTTHVFEASKETVQDLKVGDRLKAKLRPLPGCK